MVTAKPAPQVGRLVQRAPPPLEKPPPGPLPHSPLPPRQLQPARPPAAHLQLLRFQGKPVPLALPLRRSPWLRPSQIEHWTLARPQPPPASFPASAVLARASSRVCAGRWRHHSTV